MASVAVGAGVAALAATAVLQGPMEDLLSITLGVLGIYAGVLNIPLRRATVKSKVRRRASELSKRKTLFCDQHRSNHQFVFLSLIVPGPG